MEKLKILWQKLDKMTSGVPKLVILLGFLILVLRLPSLFEPCWHGDEGIYLTIGQEVSQGHVLYRDVHDNKPPLIYLLAAIAGNVFWFRFILLLWTLVTVWLFFELVKEIFPKEKLLRGLLTSIFAILTSIPTFEGNVANAEIFFVGLIIVGFLAFLKKKYFWAGFLLGLSFLFKAPPLFDFSALLVFVLLKIPSRKDLRVSLKKVILPMVLAFLLPVFITTIYYSSRGALLYYIKSAFLLNFPYLSSWGSGRGSILASGLFQRGLVLLIFLVLVFWQRRALLRQPVILLSSLWLSLALFGALLSGRPYPHYLIQIFAPLLILLGAITANFFTFVRNKKLLILVLPILLVPLAFWAYGFYTYPLLSYYQNFIQFASGQETRSQYYRRFDPRVSRNYQIARFVRETVPKDERIFIWGNEPCVYALSRRLPVGRYTVAYHIIDFDGYGETMKAMEADKPRLVVATLSDHAFPALNSFLEENYFRMKPIGTAQIWYRRSQCF